MLLLNLIGGSKFRTSKVKNTRNLPLNARLPFPWGESGYETRDAIASCACSVYDFAGEPHPQNCKTVDRSYHSVATK